jgi:outer membrane receptor protein involved in Fe transport
VAGVFYSDQNLEENFYSDFSDADIGFPPGTTPDIVLTSYGQNANSFGEFGQIDYKLDDALKVVLGAREDHETRELVNLNTGVLAGPPVASFTGGVLNPPSTTSNLPSGKFEIDYTPAAGTLVYGSVSRGVKSGGFTAHNTVSAPAADPFKPERLTAYEVGIKSDITQTLRLNTAVFYYRYRDQQILGKIFDAGSDSYIGEFVNANSRISGGEAQLEWRPVAGLLVSQYYGFTEGYYTSTLLNSDTPPVNYDGRPESIPKNSYGGEASYEWSLSGYKLTAESNYSFHDTYSQFFLLGSNDFTIPKYWLANANLSVAPAGGPWTFTLWGRNIFNKDYDITRNFFDIPCRCSCCCTASATRIPAGMAGCASWAANSASFASIFPRMASRVRPRITSCAVTRSRISWIRSRRSSICRNLRWRATRWEEASRGSRRCITRIESMRWCFSSAAVLQHLKASARKLAAAFLQSRP